MAAEHLPEDAFHVVVVADARVHGLYGDGVLSCLRSAGKDPLLVTFPPGESNKTRKTKARIEDRMLRARVGRDAVVVALGGGVTTDLAGFVAATYMRGIPCVNIPTTLLAMVDAAVGGKTGVNTPAGKNLVGVFKQPNAVLADLQTLGTLPRRQWLNGLAEMVKHAVVGDRQYMDFLCDHAGHLLAADPEVCQAAVVRSIAIKAEVVARDVREADRRRVLNFGHTVGHALEKVSGFKLSHGRAIAVGMAAEAEIAVGLGILDAPERDRLTSVLECLGLPSVPGNVPPERVVDAMRSDKKGKKSELIMALPRRIGRMKRTEEGWGVRVDPGVVRRALKRLANRR